MRTSSKISMPEALMMLINSFNRSAYYQVNKVFAKRTSNNCAIFIAELLWELKKVKTTSVTIQAYRMEKKANISNHERRRVEELLKEVGVLKVVKKGIPPMHTYTLDPFAVMKLMQESVETEDDNYIELPSSEDADYEDASAESMEQQSPRIGSNDAPPSNAPKSGATILRISERRSSEKRSIENAATPEKSTGSEDLGAIKKKDKIEDNNTQSLPAASDAAETKDRASEGTPDPTSTTASEHDGAGLGAAAKIDSTGGRIAPASVGEGGPPDPLLKKDGTPRKDARERAFIGYFIEEFAKAHGSKPILDASGGKNTIMARTILRKMEGKSEELARIVQRYVQNPDPFFAEKGWPLSILAADSVLQQHSDVTWRERQRKQPLRTNTHTVGRSLDS